MSARCDGYIRVDECAYHKEVVWDFDCLQKDVHSPIFVEGRQKYALRFHNRNKFLFPLYSIELYRMGPACGSPEGSVLWLAGLKLPDGTYYHRIRGGILDLKTECGRLDLKTNSSSLELKIESGSQDVKESWIFQQPVLLEWFEERDVKMMRLASEGRLTFFWRLSTMLDAPAAEVCVHGATGVSAWGDGSVQKEACPLHTEVQWNFRLDSSLPIYYCFVSPEFVIGNQRYRLELASMSFEPMNLNLYRLGPSEKGASVEWWAGLKRPDGSRYIRNASGQLDLEAEYQLMQMVAILNRFRRDELHRLQPCEGGEIAVFFLLSGGSTSTAADVCTHGATGVPVWGDGSVLKEACPLHTEVQWNVRLESSLPSYCCFVSPEFDIGNQRYRLELVSTSYEPIDLNLYRLGPSQKGASASVEWWAGVKRHDGSRYSRNVSGQLDLEAECQLMKMVANLKRFDRDEIRRLVRWKGGEMTVFFILSGGRTSTAADVCTHGATWESAWGDGSVLQEACPLHTEVQWNVRLESSLPVDCCFVSPEFFIGYQRYRLELVSISVKCMDLKLYRLGPSEKGGSESVEWWVGLKRPDGSRYHRNVSGKLDLQAECQLMKMVSTLKRFARDEVRRLHRWAGGEMAVFLLLSGGRTSTAADVCTHGATGVSAWGDGSVLKEACPLHTEVQWNVRLASSQPIYGCFVSPEFDIGNQRYRLELVSTSYECMDLNLYRLGPSQKGASVEWWAGLKRHDGSRYHRNASGQLDLEAECQLMKMVATLKRFARDEVHRLHRWAGGEIAIFFLWSDGLTLTAADVCTHGATGVPAWGDGSVLKEACPLHTEVQWNVRLQSSLPSYCCLVSPEFDIGNQRYRLELVSISDKRFDLMLYRLGPSEKGESASVEWWAGVKRHDGSRCHRNASGQLDLEAECQFMKKVATLKRIATGEIDWLHRREDGEMTVFFRLTDGRTSTAADVCTHGISRVSAWGDGRVLKEACPLHTEVQWNLLESSLPRYCCFVSPEFVIGNQRYRLELLSISYERMELKLYRLGPSERGASESVEWWAGLKRHDGTRYHRNASGQLDLEAECQFMKKVAILKRFATDEVRRLHRSQGREITVFFLLSGGSTSTAADVCTHGAAYLLAWNDGVIREEDCPSHKEVEWNVCCRLALEGVRNLASPVFVVGSQHYLLELSLIGGLCLSLSLFRMGPSAGSVRWWAGLKRCDGTYYNRIESKKLELKRNCDMWTEVESVKTVTLSELDAEYLDLDRCATFFLRISGEESSDVCIQSAPEMFGRVVDSIREEGSPFHRQVEWDFCYEPSSGVQSVTSPLFVHLNQSYMFELRRLGDVWELHLLSRFIVNGIPEVLGYWAGLKCGDGTYNHRIDRRKLCLLEDCEAWWKVARLKRITRCELEREHLSPDGLVTCFFRANLQSLFPSLETCTRDVVVVPARGEGIIRSEERSSCTHVEWEFEHPQEHRSLTSPEFGIGNQRYLLELSMDPEIISLHLYRKGPSCLPDLRTVRCWAGLKRGDGSYYHRNMRGKVKVHNECKMWTKVKLLYAYTAFEVERKLLTPCGKLVAFFRCGSSDEFDLGPPNLSSRGDGSIREVEGTSCKEVAWTVEPDKRWFAVSAEFTFDDQRFLLELTLESREYAKLILFRAGHYAKARWWAGLKRADGSYHHRTEAGELEVWGYEMWRWEQLLKRVALSELETQQLMLDGKLTFFVLFAEAAAESPFLGFAELSAEGAGAIREGECSTHKEVEWQIPAIPQKSVWTLSSPEFEIGGQRYFLELSRASSPNLDLYRMGPSVDCPRRFWVGLKKFDGAYYHWNKRGMLDLKENCVVWREVKRLCTFLNFRFDEEYFSPSCPVTLFFRLSLERQSAGSEVCIHGSADASTGGDGRIREEECPSHKYLEWEVILEPLKIWTSPSFGVENQLYLLELRTSVVSHMKLRLFRMGPIVDGSVRCWVGTNCDYWPESGKVDLGEECEVWRKATRLKKFHERDLPSGGPVTFSLLFSLRQSSTSLVKACTHVSLMVSKPRAGSVAEEAWPSYKLVEWDIGCELTQAREKVFTSPDFSIGNQRFLLDVWCGKNYQSVQVFRMGLSEDRSAQWILAAKDREGTYEESKYGKLDLGEAYEIWSKVEHVHLRGKFEPDKRNYLSISFLMSLERTPTTTVVGNSDVETLQNSQSLGREEVIFKVQGKEFKVHRAVIRIRVPTLDAMFKHDTLEKRTGVVQIEDCDPAVFEVFVKYVVTGELQALPMDEDFALYALADKYLIGELRLRCLRRIEESLSADSFCDVVELIFRYGWDDLLKIASQFLARNRDIVQSDVWQNFKREYPNAASNLETGAFQHGNLN